ncbi:hypothetical protein L1987_38141 [Smallanthus sonchifolius]|uniref:Uncharacterized protein n=1 Tax=Smallanthus sonchifolius TaxID=185202 RepID=A0ACB9HJ29_9ASTR|nr:hypothetical protein L1987_38141 [Smallanthus sonchifolius]
MDDNLLKLLSRGSLLEYILVFKCKTDDRHVVVKNKARLVVQGFYQQEGLDYTELYAPVARLEVILLFLAYASYVGFKVYQLDVKSAFLYGKVHEEVYVTQPPGFEDPHNINKVYKLDKALYGLHQAPRAWEFEQVMKSKFEMSNMGELSFFLGLEVSQIEDGIYLHQSKYVQDILSKYKMKNSSTYGTPILVNHDLQPDKDGKDVDCNLYRGMIGSLMFLTTSRLDIMFVVCLYSRFQSQPKESHLIAVKRIFRYLKGKPRLGLWWMSILGRQAGFWQCKKQSTVSVSTCEAEYIAAASVMARAFTSEFNLLALTQPEWKGAALEYREKVDFLNRSKIIYSISADPIVSRPYLEQFWDPTYHHYTVVPNVIQATATCHEIAISEDTIRRVLQFQDLATDPISYPDYFVDGCWRQ